MRAIENTEQQTKDSEMIFTQITNGNFDNYDAAEQAVVILYVMDETISRAGISHAMGRLKRYYNQR